MQKKHLALIKVLACLIIAASFLYLNAIIVDPDLGWHLTVGERILAERAVPQADIYSHTMPGYQWVDHEWFVNAWFAWMSARGLWWIVIFAFALLSCAPFFVWLARASSLLGVLLTILVAILVTPFLGVRPQTISFALFFILFEILYARVFRRAQGKTTLHVTVLVPALFLVWANLHAGFFSGIVLLVVFIAADHFFAWRKRMGVSSKHLAADLVLICASVLVTLINPYGMRLYGEFLTIARSHDVFQYIVEWRPGFLFPSFALSAFLGFFFFSAVRFRKEIPGRELLIPLLFFAMFMKSIRMAPLFFVTAVPMLMGASEGLVREVSDSIRALPRRSQIVKNFAVIGLCILVAALAFFGKTAFGYKNAPYPQGAVEYLRGQANSGRSITLFNAYEWGGYVIQKAPEVKVFIDGRMPHWVHRDGDSAMRDFVRAMYGIEGENAREEVFLRRKITTVLIKKETMAKKQSWIVNVLPLPIAQFVKQSSFFRVLHASLTKDEKKSLEQALREGDWRVAYRDDVAIIFECSPSRCGENREKKDL